MAGIRSYWEELGVNNVSQINSMSEGFITLLKSCKTDWEIKDYLIRKLLNYRFLELQSIRNPGGGNGFILDLGDENFAAGVFGRGDLKKRGVSIISCSLDTPLIEVGARAPALMPESEISTVRFRAKNRISLDQWLNFDVSIHGRMKVEKVPVRSFVLGEHSREPRFSLSPAPDETKKTARSKEPQIDLIIGTERKSASGKKEYNMDFLKSLSMDAKGFNASSLYLVPSVGPHEHGADRSMIRAYGSYERLPAFAALKTLTDITSPDDTVVVVFYSQRSASGRKTLLKDLISKTVDALVKKGVEGATERMISEIFEQSRLLNVSNISQKKRGNSDQTAVKPLPVGKGPLVGTLPSTMKTGKSGIITELVVEKLEKGNVPFLKVPRNYEFDTGDLISSTFTKSISALVNVGFARMEPEDRIVSTISKMDLWSAYKTMLAYATY